MHDPQPADPTSWVRIGRIAREVGLAGWVKVEPLTDFYERFSPGACLTLLRRMAAPAATPPVAAEAATEPAEPIPHVEQVVVADARDGPKGSIQLLFTGIETCEGARALVGSYIVVRAEDRMPLADDQFYTDELTGLVVCNPDGSEVGTVEGFDDVPGNPYLTLRTADGREALVPFRRVFVARIDRRQRRLHLAVPLATLMFA